MHKETKAIPTTNRPVDLDSVLRAYYPDIHLGNRRESLDEIMAELAKHGVVIHPDTVGALRADSNSVHRPSGEYIARLLLLKAHASNQEWSTPSVAKNTEHIISSAEEIESYQPLSTWGLRKSNGLSKSLAQEYGVHENIIKSIFQGIRIDGAYIAQNIPEANDHLIEAVRGYITDFYNQPPSIQSNPDAIMNIEKATDARNLYAALYTAGEQSRGFRRIGALVPYELDYWKWLLQADILNQQKHTPFSSIVIDAYSSSNGFTFHDSMSEQVRNETGIFVTEQAVQTRYHLIQQDLPSQL